MVSLEVVYTSICDILGREYIGVEMTSPLNNGVPQFDFRQLQTVFSYAGASPEMISPYLTSEGITPQGVDLLGRDFKHRHQEYKIPFWEISPVEIQKIATHANNH